MAKQINEEDFKKIFEQYKNLVFKTAYLILRDVQEAEDVLQEVFIKLYKSAGSIDSTKGGYGPWLYKVTTNHCISNKRKKRFPVSNPVEEKGFEGPYDFPEKDGQSVDELAMQNQEIEELWKVMKELSAKHRAVLALRYFNDLSYEEIANIMNIPLGTVKSRINMAISYVRKAMLNKESGRELR